jgi:hypothetical protein
MAKFRCMCCNKIKSDKKGSKFIPYSPKNKVGSKICYYCIEFNSISKLIYVTDIQEKRVTIKKLMREAFLKN